MTREQIERKYGVRLKYELTPHRELRHYWSVEVEGKEIAREKTLAKVEDALKRIKGDGDK